MPTVKGDLNPNRNPPARVRLISESTFTVRGHGVHSIFEECVNAISEMGDVELVSGPRSLASSVILHSHTIGPIALIRLLIHPGFREITAHVTPSSLIESIRLAGSLAWLTRRYMRFAYNRADRILAVSDATAGELSALKVRKPIVISYNAIDDGPIRSLTSQRSELRTLLGWQGQTVILAVGQLQPRKGIIEFIECAAALPNLRFVWVGGMPFGLLSAQRSGIARSCSMAPGNVTFAGMMPRADAFRYYAAADVFFLPSRQETFGLATLEAATAGLPLVLHELECYRGWLGNAYMSGTCTEEYIALLRRLEDPGLRISLGANAARVARDFGKEALIESLRNAYKLPPLRSVSSPGS